MTRMLFRGGEACTWCGTVLHLSQAPVPAGGARWVHRRCTEVPAPLVAEVLEEALRRVAAHPGTGPAERGALERLVAGAPRRPVTPARAARWTRRVAALSPRAGLEVATLAAAWSGPEGGRGPAMLRRRRPRPRGPVGPASAWPASRTSRARPRTGRW